MLINLIKNYLCVFVLYTRACITSIIWPISKKVTERLIKDTFPAEEYK